MNEEKDNWMNHVKEIRTTHSFTTNVETIGKVKQFKEKYDCRSISQAIDDLVNIGLASVGFRTQKEINDRFEGTHMDFDFIDVPKIENIDFISSNIMNSDHDKMRVTLDIIKKISNESNDNSAERLSIIKEGVSLGMNHDDMISILNKLKRIGMIYEIGHNKFKNTID